MERRLLPPGRLQPSAERQGKTFSFRPSANEDLIQNDYVVLVTSRQLQQPIFGGVALLPEDSLLADEHPAMS